MFLGNKFDPRYNPESPLYKWVINPLLGGYSPENEDEEKALQILKAWDGNADKDSRGAAIANIVYRKFWIAHRGNRADIKEPDIKTEFKEAVTLLGRCPHGDLQRLRRGKTDLPLGGCIDVLNAIHIKIENGPPVGTAGDSYILFVEFADEGVRSWSRYQCGNVNRPDSHSIRDLLGKPDSI